MIDTFVGDGFRWYIVVVGFVAAGTMLASWVLDRRSGGAWVPSPRVWWDDFAEWAALLGGAGTCFWVGFGSLGVLLGWDSLFRLPGLAAALTFSAVGRGIQLWRRLH